MRFEGFHIDGFGLFRDIVIKGLSPNLTVFLGDNESGKSTLLGFIRAVLFGFPDGRSSENPYPPLAGGRHGGNIDLLVEGDGRYVVERHQGPRGGKVEVLQPDQTLGGRDLLDSLLMIGNRTLFRNIFAFSLSELQEFETLNREAVSEALHSAGAGIDPRGLADMRAALDRREADLFKPGGVKPRINRGLSRLGTITKEKKGLQGSIEEYDGIRKDISRLAGEIEALDLRRGELTLEFRNTERLLNIRPEWINLIVSRQRLEELDRVENFPPQGLVRLEGLKERLSDLERELLEKGEELKRRESELEALTIDAPLLGQGSPITRIQKDLGHFRAVTNDIITLDRELTLGEQRLGETATPLGPQWDEERILSFDLSIAAREAVRDSREILNRLKQEEQGKRDSLEAAVSSRREAEAVLREMDEPPVKDRARLEGMLRSCRDLRRMESEERLLREELRHREERLHDLEEERRILEGDMTSGTRPLPLWPIPSGIGAGLIVLFLSGFMDEWTWGLVVTGLSGLFVIVYWLFRAAIRKAAGERAGGMERRLNMITVKTGELEAEITATNRGIEKIGERISETFAGLSLSGKPPAETLDKMEQELSVAVTGLDRWREAERAVEQAEKQHERAVEGLRRAETEKEKKLAEWGEWLREKGLDPGLSPEGALETLSLIQSLREQAEALARLRSKKKSLERERSMYIDLVNDTLESCNRDPADGDGVQAAVEILIQDFTTAERAAQKREILIKEAEAGRGAVDRLRRQELELRKEIRDFMASGGSDNEEDFRKRGQIFEETMGLKKEIERCEDNIKRLSGNPEKFNEVVKEVSEADLEELEGRSRSLERELEGTEAALDRDKREQARLEERIRQLVKDERISELRAEEEGIREELRSLTEEWVVVRLAKYLIRMARARYERERQPRVIAEAGRFFNQMTLGKYPSIVSPIGENRIEIVCHDNSRKGIDQLSRGTAEQLYLSLRFGFIREFSRRSDPLPVIMDEILVNFDLERARATLKGIVELAGEHQVLFFTCHKYMVALFREVDSRIPVLSISGGEVRELPQ